MISPLFETVFYEMSVVEDADQEWQRISGGAPEGAGLSCVDIMFDTSTGHLSSHNFPLENR